MKKKRKQMLISDNGTKLEVYLENCKSSAIKERYVKKV